MLHRGLIWNVQRYFAPMDRPNLGTTLRLRLKGARRLFIKPGCIYPWGCRDRCAQSYRCSDDRFLSWREPLVPPLGIVQEEKLPIWKYRSHKQCPLDQSWSRRNDGNCSRLLSLRYRWEGLSKVSLSLSVFLRWSLMIIPSGFFYLFLYNFWSSLLYDIYD